MRYLSTRDPRPTPATHGFEDVLLAGLAEDGGLYVPELCRRSTRRLCAPFAGLPSPSLAARKVLALFAGGAFVCLNSGG